MTRPFPGLDHMAPTLFATPLGWAMPLVVVAFPVVGHGAWHVYEAMNPGGAAADTEPANHETP